MQGMNFLHDFLSSFIASLPEKPPRPCMVCGSPLTPIPEGAKQFAYYEIRRKDGWTIGRGIVCSEGCALEYEKENLPSRFPLNESGYIYLMQAEWGYKIGYSKTPEKRRQRIASKHKKLVKLLHTIKVPHQVGAEKYLQYRFQKLRIKMSNREREWFALGEKEVKYIMGINDLPAWRPYFKSDIAVARFPWN
jgi:hypothetical protein